MAIVLCRQNKTSDARDRCRKAIGINKNWRAELLLVKLTESKKEAKDILKKLVERYEKNAT